LSKSSGKWLTLFNIISQTARVMNYLVTLEQIPKGADPARHRKVRGWVSSFDHPKDVQLHNKCMSSTAQCLPHSQIKEVFNEGAVLRDRVNQPIGPRNGQQRRLSLACQSDLKPTAQYTFAVPSAIGPPLVSPLAACDRPTITVLIRYLHAQLPNN